MVDYSIPFIIDQKESGLELLDEKYCILEALRIISAENTGNFLGLGNKEHISSIDLIYIPFYLIDYNKSRCSLIFFDELLSSEFSISLPKVLVDNVDSLCEEISKFSSPLDFVGKLKNILNSSFNQINERHDTYYTVARKDIADCLYKFKKFIKKIEGNKFVLADCKNSERYSEICEIYGVMKEQEEKYEYLETNLKNLISTVNQKNKELKEKTIYQRINSYNKHSEKIDPLEKKFNEEIHPVLLAKLNEGKDPIEKELNELYRKYKEDIIPRLVRERDIDLSSFDTRINKIRSEFDWEIKKIESERSRDLTNISSEKRRYENKDHLSLGGTYDAEITSYHVKISNYKKLKKQYEDMIDKLKKDEDTSKLQSEHYSKIREFEREIDKSQREIRSIENEKYAKAKQLKKEYNINMASYDTKKSNIQRDYSSSISNLRSAMDEQIRNIEKERDLKSSFWDGKIAEYETIYSNERSKLLYSRDLIQQEYDKSVAEEKSKFEPMKQEREQEDKIYENAITSLKDTGEKFNAMASNYLDRINEEFENITEFFGMPLDFMDEEEYSEVIRLLAPVYIAEIKDKKNNLRLSILPPLIYKNGECSYGQSSYFGSIKSTIETIITEAPAQKEDQPILHHEIRKRLKSYLDNNQDIRNVVLNHIRNNSKINNNPENIKKLRLILEMMKKEEKIQEKEYKRVLKIVSSN